MLQEKLSQRTVDDRFAAMVYETTGEIISVPQEATEVLLETAQEALEQGPETDLGQSLQEQYNLQYDPVEVMRGLGSTGIALAEIPEKIESAIEQNAMSQTSEQLTLKEEDLPPVENYRSGDAQRIIAGLLRGDKTVLNLVPENFKEALSVRIDQDVRELDDGIITEGFFREEIAKVIMVAGNGLWASDYPVAYQEFVESH